jgi:tyrosyl-tRNA synthetase
MSVYKTLEDRGFVAQATDAAAIASWLEGPPGVVYTGYDPTADCLHVGHLVTLMALLHLQRAGHRLVLLVGTGTAKIGDPSGRSALRPMLEGEQIAAHAASLSRQLKRFFEPEGKPQVVYNADWLDKLSYIEFLRDIGRHFSVNRMLGAEMYKQRLAQGLSFIEFNYQLLQAYDFLHLQRAHGCRLQVGGDDQWSNILAGTELNRRVDGVQVHGLTLPLLTTASGQKMGKTQQGAVWLDASRCRPEAYFQYFVNTHDADVGRFLRLFTFLPLEEIIAMEAQSGAALNDAKHILAYESCQLLHGRAAADQAYAAARQAFGQRPVAADLLPSSQLPRQVNPQAAAADLPQTVLCRHTLEAGLSVIDLLVQVGLAPSKNAARRLIDQGGVRWGNRTLTDSASQVGVDWFVDGPQLLWAGKKRHHRLGLGPLTSPG